MTLLNDEQLAERRAQIPVHCGSCGATFPGDTELSNGACRECCRSDVHLLRTVERYRKALEIVVAEGSYCVDGTMPEVERKARVAHMLAAAEGALGDAD